MVSDRWEHEAMAGSGSSLLEREVEDDATMQGRAMYSESWDRRCRHGFIQRAPLLTSKSIMVTSPFWRAAERGPPSWALTLAPLFKK